LNEIELIVEMLRQTFDGRAWHGPSFMDVLNGVDKAQAIERPVEAGHTILEIVNHCSFWMEAVGRALHGERMPDIESTEDWPKMGTTVEEWTNAREKLKKAYEELVNSAKDLNEAQLAQKVHGSYSGQAYAVACRRMLHGISDHNTYHAGQIAVLRKKTV
jgi:uncharacterized damage-inducible protein DinB